MVNDNCWRALKLGNNLPCGSGLATEACGSVGTRPGHDWQPDLCLIWLALWVIVGALWGRGRGVWAG